ncbi:MAG: GlsB/YeaQ/YmgE family stress response membrane protein [Thermodesulfobacteriota bacterium]
MGILSWMIFGLIAGWLAKIIMPGKDPGGFFVTIAIGVAGGLLGGFLGTMIGFGSVSGFNIKSFITAIVGALILLWLYRVVKKK